MKQTMKRPSMDLGPHDQDRSKRVKDTVAADGKTAVQFPAASLPMPLVPPGPWPYPSSFPLMPPMGLPGMPMGGMPFCFPPPFFPAPFMFPPFWFANAMNACSAAGVQSGTAAGSMAVTVPNAAAGATAAPAAPAGMAAAPFAMPFPMMAPMAAMPGAGAAGATVAPQAAAPLSTTLLQQLSTSMDSTTCSPCATPETCVACPQLGVSSVPTAPDAGPAPAMSDANMPSVSDASIAAPATPEVNDISDQEFVSFIDSFLNLPDDGLACSIPLMVGGAEDDDATDDQELNPLGLKLSKSDSLLNLLDRELACAANASACFAL